MSDPDVPSTGPEWLDLTGLSADQRVESALVFELSPGITDAVQQLRMRMADVFGGAATYRPHVTLLYLGRMWVRQLNVLESELRPLCMSRASAQICRIDAFETDGCMINIHLRLDSPDVHSLHARALERARRHRFFDPGPFVGAGYVPHITLLDELDPGQRPPAQFPASGLEGMRVKLTTLRMWCVPIPTTSGAALGSAG